MPIFSAKASCSTLTIFDLANMEIKVNEGGFSIWLLEPGKSGKLHKRWIVDGSECAKDGIISFATNSDFFKVHINKKEGWAQIQKKEVNSP